MKYLSSMPFDLDIAVLGADFSLQTSVALSAVHCQCVLARQDLLADSTHYCHTWHPCTIACDLDLIVGVLHVNATTVTTTLTMILDLFKME